MYDYDAETTAPPTMRRPSFNSTEVRLWRDGVLSGLSSIGGFNSTEVRLWLKGDFSAPTFTRFQFYRSTIMTQLCLECRNLLTRFNSTEVRLWLIIFFIIIGIVLICFNSTEVRLWLSFSLLILQFASVFQFYRSTIMTLAIVSISHQLTGFNSTEVRLWRCTALSWGLVPLFQFYRSTIMTGTLYGAFGCIAVSILQKYDYDLHLCQLSFGALRFNSTEVRLWHFSAARVRQIPKFQFYRSTIMTDNKIWCHHTQ